MKKYNLLSFKEYSKKKHTTPYFYSINRGGQFLFYVGFHHSNDPKNPDFKILKKYWQEFLKKTKSGNCLVLNEGGTRKLENSEKKAIKIGGAASLVTFWASKAGIETLSPEPTKEIELKHLLKKFTKEEIIYFYFIRRVSQYHRLLVKPKFEEYLGEFLKREKKETKWKNFDFSLEHIYKIHRKIFGFDFNPKDKQFAVEQSNPTIFKSKINDVARETTITRDNWIIGEIEKFWEEGKSLFIVYGSSHAIMQEPAIKVFLQLPEPSLG